MSTLRALILLGLQSQDRASQPICCLSQHQVRALSVRSHVRAPQFAAARGCQGGDDRHDLGDNLLPGIQIRLI
jgi:hypothetical protein